MFAAYDRALLEQAQERGLITDPGTHHHEVERGLRAAARETPGTALHTATAAPDQVLAYAMAADLDPADPDTRDRWARTLGRDAVAAWPPERNQVCWCGSGRKYKKCCGAPSVR